MKNVQQVFVGLIGDPTAAIAPAAIPTGSFSVLDGLTTTTIATIGATTDFFHFAMGTAGDTVVSDSFPSATPRTSSVAAYTAAVDKGISIDIGSVSCETEYMFKIRFEGEAIAKTYGYNDLIKTFSYTTECCDPCSTACPSGSCLDLMWGLAVNVNADPEMLVAALINSTAFAAAAATPSGGVVTQADVDAYIVYVTAPATLKTEAEICADLSFGLMGQTAAPSALVCGQDPMSLTQTVVDYHVGLLGGFECNGSSQTVMQAIVFASGEPYQVANLARWAEGYKRRFGVYRTPFPYDTFVSNGVIDPAGTYDIVTISLQTLDPGAATLNPTVNNHEIIVAVPAGATGPVIALLA
tara:strand:- start:4334 stop:5395 length:1062 start_codon:yes stop_codon:yes gene_type:complete